MSIVRRLYVVLIICIMISATATYCQAGKIVDKIVAIINDDVITQSEVEESMLSFVADYQLRYGAQKTQDKISEVKNDALNRLIEEKLLLQEANKREVKVNKAQINAILKSVKGKFDSEEEFEKVLTKSGMTTDKLKKKYRDQLLVKQLVNGVITHNTRVSPTQISAYYHGHKEEFMQQEQVKFRIILLKFKPEQSKMSVRALAEELLDRIRSEEDFAMLAQQYSEGPNAIGGGDMGFVPKGSMVAEIDQILFSLEEGEASNVIETPLGCNIVKIEKRLPASELPLEKATLLVRQRLYEREAELVFREFIENLKKEAYIDIK